VFVFKSLGVGHGRGIGATALTLASALMLAACGAPRPHPTPHAPSANAAEAAPRPTPPAGRLYDIDAAQSELRILVYRAAPLARLGHNHVVVNRTLHGSITLPDGAASTAAPGFSLRIPAAGFVVDDGRARREEGADFAAEVSPDAKAGTLRNMLSAAVLDADAFPVISIASVAVTKRAVTGGFEATVTVGVAGHESRLVVPIEVQSDAAHLSATGSLELRQSTLGLTPYSLMLGALQVQDAMTVKFKIVARPA
jgi:hypothetical protein